VAAGGAAAERERWVSGLRGGQWRQWVDTVAGSVLVVYVLHQREFQSRTFDALTGPSIVNRSLQLPANTFRELRTNVRVA
jgi:hypothetical protein